MAGCSKTKQTGVVLVVGLIFLLVMTIIGVTAIQGSTMQERMAANSSDRNAVFQGAEIALQVGEAQVIAQDCSSLAGVLADRPNPDDPDNWAGSTDVPVSSNEHFVASRAYVISRIPPQQSSDESAAAEDDETCGGFYYVTAKADSPKGMTVVVQSTVFKRF